MAPSSAPALPEGRRSPLRVALLTNLLPPYRLPVYRALAATSGWRLRFLVGAESAADWECAYAGSHARACRELDIEVIPSRSLRRRAQVHATARASQPVELQLPFGALGALARFAPDVVVSAELGARTALAAWYARRRRIPLVIWSYQSRAWAATAGSLRRAWRRALLGRAATVVGMGSQARAVLRELGVPEARIFDAPNAHDRAAFARALAQPDHAALRAARRAALGCRERVALVAGRLVEAKGVRELIRAWQGLDSPLRRRWTLLLVGDGPLRAELGAAAARHEPGGIVCTGAVPAAEMPNLYGCADLLVFPSLGDPWGLVVNEALACGVPVLCSRLAGCAEDLLGDAQAGWCFDPTDPTDFSRALREALECGDLAARGARGRDRAKRFGPEQMADGLRRAIAHAAGLSA